jgi:hypothetical protein
MILRTRLLGFFLLLSVYGFSQIVNINDSVVTANSYTSSQIILSGKSELHITASTNPLTNSTVSLNSDNAWLFFDNIRPQAVINSYLPYILVNGNASVLKTNLRVSIYKNGTVVIPESSTYQPLKVYTGQNFQGDSASYSMFTFYNSLGKMDNKIRSFKLKRGYMVTFATVGDGTGYSRVYIADKADLVISAMPLLLDNCISFIRVLNWEYPSKKGWAGSNPTEYGLVNATWRYDWSAGGSTTPLVEYVPIRQNGGWPNWSDIDSKQYVSHVLGFNEPDHTEQSNLTVSQALAQWPDMLRTGLRIGSPACTNFSWLYQFIDSCRAKNYRVDYVAVHAYWGGKSPANWYNDLKYIHTRTGLPIWITEWNNGANWTTEWWPSDSLQCLTKQLNDLKGILQVMDTASFIERYSIYNWVENKRAMVINGVLTPAGQYYSNDNAPMAYNKANDVVPGYVYGNPSLSLAISTNKVSLLINDPNGDYYTGYIVEKKLDAGTYQEIGRFQNTTVKTFTDTLDMNLASKVRYRIRSIFNNGLVSAYSNEVGYDITKNGDIQFGNVSVSNIGWNPVLFGKPYTAIPAIILGAPTNFNSSVLMSVRPKLISYSSRFNIQAAPWSYQHVTTLLKEETIPYIIVAAGTYDFGGLKAIVNRASIGSSWTHVSFSAPFDSVPVVFVSQLNPANTFATCVRVRNVSATGFDAKLQKETAITTALSTETVSFLAITKGKGLINGNNAIVGCTPDKTVGITYNTINYGDSIVNPVFISQMQTCNDDTVTATLRCVLVSNKYANVVKQRERSTGITSAAAEMVGWMALNPQGIIQAVNNPTFVTIKLFPNPATEYIYFENGENIPGLVEIYDMSGILIEKTVVSDHKIDISKLPSGNYVLKTSLGISKFIKN